MSWPRTRDGDPQIGGAHEPPRRPPPRLPRRPALRADGLREVPECWTVRFAYADPPYPGCARAHYADDPRCCEVNHEILIGTLCKEYPDGWALSTSSPALRQVLPLCPEDVRVAAWVKPFAAMRKGVVPMSAWEPVIYRSGVKRKWTKGGRSTLGRVHDWIVAMPPVFVGEHRGISGAKPLTFCFWILDLCGYRIGDTMDDIFPGSGIMERAVRLYEAQSHLFDAVPHDASRQEDLL